VKIRSITYFCDPHYPLDAAVLRAAGAFVARAKLAYEAAGYEVQSTRLATVPFPSLLGEQHIHRLPELAREMDLTIPQVNIGYASLGPALPGMPRSYEVIPEALAASHNVFFGGVMADKVAGLDLAAVRRCAQVIVKAAPVEPNGFANLRFAAMANVKPGVPFFPASYHAGSTPALALAVEGADLAVQAFSNAQTIPEGRQALVAEIEKHGKALLRVAQDLSRFPTPNFPSSSFGGIDFSLAPFPSEGISLGAALEHLGVPKLGRHGSLAAAAILTECIDRARFARTGFCGLMLPVLEDSTLAQRTSEGTLTVKDLLMYSAVCGTGLDTVPLPGNTSVEQLVPVLIDIAALALRLDKPLTARLMPVPRKKAGDLTAFDFAYFAKGRVMALDSAGLHGPLGGSETFPLNSR
jgi:uncharacterized protein (UPF0210 family)